MYRNFSLTDTERKQIMEQHAAHGYKKPINEIFGATWLTKIKIDSPEELTDEQKHDMADKFQRQWNGLVAVEFAPGEWFNQDGKIENIEEYETHVNTNIYGKERERPGNAEFETKVKNYHRNTEPDSPHQYQYSSYDDYEMQGIGKHLTPAEKKEKEDAFNRMKETGFSFGVHEAKQKLKESFNRFAINEQLTDNQRLASQKGYGPVSVEYANQLEKEGKLLATAPNNQPAQNSASAPAGSAAPASAAAEVKAPDINVNCAASLAEIKKGSMKILKYGCKTDAVKELQKLLGMEEKYQTGYFGNMTKGKVIEFQKANKDPEGKDLVPDGKVGDKTYSVMAYKKITTTSDAQKTATDATTNKAATDSTQTATDSTAVKVNETGEVDENLGKLVGTAVKKGAQYVDDVMKYFKKPAQKGAFPVKQGVQKAADVYVPKSAQPAMKSLLQKYGSQRWTPGLNIALQPARQEMAIVVNDLKRLRSQLPGFGTGSVEQKQYFENGIYDGVTSLRSKIEGVLDSNMTGCLKYEKGTPFDFNASIGLIEDITKTVNAVMSNKKLNPDAIKTLQFMRENLNDASIKIQMGLTDLLTTK